MLKKDELKDLLQACGATTKARTKDGIFFFLSFVIKINCSQSGLGIINAILSLPLGQQPTQDHINDVISKVFSLLLQHMHY